MPSKSHDAVLISANSLRTKKALALLCFVCAAGCSQSATESPAKPSPTALVSWNKLHVGLFVYTGSDGGGVATQTVCKSVGDFIAALDSDSATRNCSHLAPGLAATVQRIVPNKVAIGGSITQAPYVLLRALKGTDYGYTTAVSLQPRIPRGAHLVMVTIGNAIITLAPSRASLPGEGPNLGDNVGVEVLSQEPTSMDRDIHVRVLTGTYRGKTAWMFSGDAKAPDGSPAGTILY